MIYLLSVFICLWLSWKYDFAGYTRNKWLWYYFLLFWFICISGFQYMVGTDMPGYVKEHESMYDTLIFGIGEKGRYKPGWILLSYSCRRIVDDFVLLKIIHAFFINVAFFSFFKRESKYIFTCILLYALSSYLILNFNVLRQSFSIGFSLYAISYLRQKKYFWSFLFLFFGYMFHNTAVLTFIIPLFVIIKPEKIPVRYLTSGIICTVLVMSYFLLKIDIESIMDKLLNYNLLGDSIAEMGTNYLNNTRLGVKEARMGITRFSQIFLITISIVYYLKHRRDLFFVLLGIVYLMIIVATFSMPILFRFRLYFEIPYYVVFADFLIECPKYIISHKEADYSKVLLFPIRNLLFICILSLYSFFPIKEYSMKYEGSHYRYIDQYYPYSSIFFPKIDYMKNHFMEFSI